MISEITHKFIEKIKGWAKLISIVDSEIAVPVDIQFDSRQLSKTVQTHTNTSVLGNNGSNSSAWIPCDGFDKLSLHVKNDANTSLNIFIDWSTDGATQHGTNGNVSTGAVPIKTLSADVQGTHFRINVINTDALPHTVNVWSFLKV